mgnify:FL=1
MAGNWKQLTAFGRGTGYLAWHLIRIYCLRLENLGKYREIFTLKSLSNH